MTYRHAEGAVFGDDTLTIRQTAEDAHGDPLPPGEDDVVVGGCYVQPLNSTSPSSTEDDDRKTLVTTLYKVFVPGDPPIRPTSRIQVNGAGPWYEVVGEPNRWHLPDGAFSHIEVQMRQVTG